MITGILVLLMASILFGISPTFTKMLTQGGMSPACVVFWTHLTILLLNLISAAVKQRLAPVSGKQAAGLLLSGVVGMGMTAFLLSSSYLLIPVGTATLLHFFYPTIVTLAMSLLFRERLTVYKLLAIVCSIVGMLLIVGTGGAGSPRGVLIALCSGGVYAFYIIINEKGCFSHLPIGTKMVWISLGSSAFFGLQSTLTGTMRAPSGLKQWLILAFVGCAAMIGYNGLSYGIKKLGATVSAFATMPEPITSVIFSSLFYAEPISLRTVVGSVFILAGVLATTIPSKTKVACAAQELPAAATAELHSHP